MTKGISINVSPKIKGLILVITGSSLWGISGNVAKYLFDYQNFSTEWLVSVRLVMSGLLLLLYASLFKRTDVMTIWKDRKSTIPLLLFSIIGMLGVQYTYFAAIEHSNAATATILQYLSPILVTIFMAAKSRKPPGLNQVAAVALALGGTFLVLTNGQIGGLKISNTALFWGLASAVTAAFYTIQPKSLLEKYSSPVIVGWGMLIGGIVLSTIQQPWQFEASWNIPSIMAVSFVILFGTLFAFLFYLESLRYLHPTQTSVLAAFEPFSATLVSLVWLHLDLGLLQMAGMILIVLTVIVLSTARQDQSES